LPQRNPHHPPKGDGHGATRPNSTEPIKALAFNTLLSSQETDTHRAGSAFAFPAPGRLALLYRIRPACQFRLSPITPVQCRLRGTFGAVKLFHQIRPDCQNRAFPMPPHGTADATKPHRLVRRWVPRCPAGRRQAGVLHP
jgi:hypothetical protein